MAARKSKLTWEWADNMHDIWIHKAKGKLTLDDIWDFLHTRDLLDVFDGALAVISFRVRADRDVALDVWEQEEEGDHQLIEIVSDDSDCPICGKHTLFPQYCPECGTSLKWEKKRNQA